MSINKDNTGVGSRNEHGLYLDPKILLLDLDSQSIQIIELADKHGKFIGGRLLGLSLYREYSDRDPLIFSNTPLNSHSYKRHLNGRVTLVGKSPLTDNIYSSNSGGPFGTWLGHQGYLAVIILGCAKEPIYADIDLHEFSSSSPKKGLLHPLPAAFSGCRFAILKDTAQTNYPEGIFGRGGFGKAFVDKNLIGLGYGFVSESKDMLPIKVEGFLKERHPSNTRPFQENFYAFGVSKILVKNNWRELSAKDIMFTSILQQIEKSEIDENPLDDLDFSRYGSTGNVLIDIDNIKKVKGPQNQTAELLGPNLGISNLQDIYNLSYLCDKYGVDSISFGAVIACAMDLFTDGNLTIEQSDGLELHFGDINVAVKCLHKICDLNDQSTFTLRLRSGVKYFAELYEFPEYAMQTKGLSFTAYNVINNPFLALLFATSIRGPDHFRGGGLMKIEGKDVADAMIHSERNGITCDILGLDRFSSIGWDDKQLIECAKNDGVTLTSEDFDRMSLQTLILERMLYLENCVGIFEDTLPKRILNIMKMTDIDDFKKNMPKVFTVFDFGKSSNLYDFFMNNLTMFYEYIGLDIYGIPKAITISDLHLLSVNDADDWRNKITEQLRCTNSLLIKHS